MNTVVMFLVHFAAFMFITYLDHKYLHNCITEIIFASALWRTMTRFDVWMSKVKA